MTFEEQVDLVDQVLQDRSITARPGPRRKRLLELGLPSDADIPRLMNHVRYRQTQRVFVRSRPSDYEE